MGGQGSPLREDAMSHELAILLQQVQETLASEYQRIVSRAQEDPGTAGDQGEENWASFLRQWLPSGYHVVTKGRILSVDGEASPQVDVLVLTPSYPPALLDKKLFLAAGVAAAFECKTTLKKEHIREAINTAEVIHRLAHPSGERSTRTGTPYLELHSGITYGLLAHAHSWSTDSASNHVAEAIHDGIDNAVHPRALLDVVCVASLGTWTTMKMSYGGPNLNVWHLDQLRDVFPHGYASAFAFGPAPEGTFAEVPGTFPNIPVAQLCAFLTSRLAWEDSSMRGIADYFRVAGLLGHGRGRNKAWRIDEVYSPEVYDRLRRGDEHFIGSWNQWGLTFM
jgi:hypothetical protein